MAIGRYKTTGGISFTVDSRALATVLNKYGIRGPQAGAIIRGEEPVPLDRFALSTYANAVFRTPAPRPPRAPRAPSIEKLWEEAMQGIRSSVKGAGVDVEDVFLNSGVSPGEFPNWLQHAAADMSQSLEYSLRGTAEQKWLKFKDALQTGNYSRIPFGEKWNLAERVSAAGEYYSDLWHGEMLDAWNKVKSDPKRFADLMAAMPPPPKSLHRQHKSSLAPPLRIPPGRVWL